MTPSFPIATPVDIGSYDRLNRLAGYQVSLTKICSFVISPHKLWLAAIIMLSSVSAQGTSVAVIVADQFIVVAADGAAKTTFDGVEYFEKYCKIRSEGATFYTAAGSYWIPALNFDLWDLAAKEVRRSKRVSETIELIEPVIGRKFPSIVEWSKTFDKKNYATWLTGTPAIAVSFVGFESDIPLAATILFQIDAAGAILKPVKNIMRVSPGTARAALLGTNTAMRIAIDAPSWGRTFIRDPVRFIEGMIQSEIDAAAKEGRKDVGPPIAILRITSKGGVFELGHEGACPYR